MYDFVARVCRELPPLSPGALVCSVPGTNVDSAVEALEVVATGGALGTGARLSKLGVDIPAFRKAYQEEIANFEKQLAARRAQLKSGDTTAGKALAKWGVQERLAIARRIRWKQGLAPTVVLEIRDNVKYGLGGRSYGNMLRRYRERGHHGANVYSEMIGGAVRSDKAVSSLAVRGARYLRHGGRAIAVVSIATTAAVFLTAPEEDLERLVYEEAGAAIGGAAGSGLAVGACLVFGIATGGWGLLACGIVGGVAGGVGGQKVGEKLYHSRNPRLLENVEAEGVIDVELLLEEDAMCVP